MPFMLFPYLSGAYIKWHHCIPLWHQNKAVHDNLPKKDVVVSTLAQLHCLVLADSWDRSRSMVNCMPWGMVDVLRGDNGIIIISRRTMTPREIMPDLTWKNVQRIHVIRIGWTTFGRLSESVRSFLLEVMKNRNDITNAVPRTQYLIKNRHQQLRGRTTTRSWIISFTTPSSAPVSTTCAETTRTADSQWRPEAPFTVTHAIGISFYIV